ncbi:MAG: FAD-dependent oxidoreductase [bacterium]
MSIRRDTEQVQTVIIGGGQAGLSVAYHLARKGAPFVVLEANHRVGDSWRKRWDSLRLFTAARYDGLAGMPFPAPRNKFPTKDEMADYLEAYAAKFELPVRTGVKVDNVSRLGKRYIVAAGDLRFEAEHVVIAMANFQKPYVPSFAAELGGDIVQMHSSDYRNPSQLKEGGVLIVGAGNSGAEISKEVVGSHRTWLSGRDTGHVPVRPDSFIGRAIVMPLVLRVIFHHLLSLATPMGRKAKAKAGSERRGAPLIRVTPQDLVAAGIHRVARMAGARSGMPLMEGGRLLDVTNVIWCTGYRAAFTSWIDLAAFGAEGEPIHDRGVVPGEPGLYFVGLHFLYAFSSVMIHGVGRDAEYVANVIGSRTTVPQLRETRFVPSGTVYANGK